MPHSTVERVDCMVTEQYNISLLRGESTLSTECSKLAGFTNGAMGHCLLGHVLAFFDSLLYPKFYKERALIVSAVVDSRVDFWG